MRRGTWLITGGAGFIGSAVVRQLIDQGEVDVINVDKLTYAGNLQNLARVENSEHYNFIQADICDAVRMEGIFNKYKPDAVMHLAAESHVDRSIDGPAEFMQTNIIGTCNLLEVARAFWQRLGEKKKASFRFHHVSTDEVYGDLGNGGGLFTEQTAYSPSSPYSASKASSDHLVRAWHRTYGLPVVLSNCSNNYGPFQFPEKLIPLIVMNALEGRALPVYGEGQQIRDWLYVDDHARALIKVLKDGVVGETYNVGGHNEMKNIDVVKIVCSVLDELVPLKGSKYSALIEFVEDRPGHDIRYAIDAEKIKNDLGWIPEESFLTGIRKTVMWYLDNVSWCKAVQDGSYQRERLGVKL